MQNPPPQDRHDTVVLGQPAPDQHDNAVLQRPAPAGAPNLPAVPPWPLPGVTGWQAVSDWRDAVVHGAPTAWSQVPPFVPAAPPPVLVMRNNPAVVGATLGSVSLFLALIPLVGLVSLVLAPIGLLSSSAGLLIGLSRRVGRVGAIWGIMTSGLALLVCLAWTSLLFAL